MKKHLRTAVLCSLMVMVGLVAVVPASASIGGSNPRPVTPPPLVTTLSIVLSILGL